MIGTLLRLTPELVQDGYSGFVRPEESLPIRSAYLSGHFIGLIIEEVSEVILIASVRQEARDSLSADILPHSSYWAPWYSQICSLS